MRVVPGGYPVPVGPQNQVPIPVIQSLDSICELCNDVLSSNNLLPENDIQEFHSSCASLVSSIIDDPAAIKAASIEDLTKALKGYQK